jgi:hypothetical protein
MARLELEIREEAEAIGSSLKRSSGGWELRKTLVRHYQSGTLNM